MTHLRLSYITFFSCFKLQVYKGREYLIFSRLQRVRTWPCWNEKHGLYTPINNIFLMAQDSAGQPEKFTNINSRLEDSCKIRIRAPTTKYQKKSAAKSDSSQVWKTYFKKKSFFLIVMNYLSIRYQLSFSCLSNFSGISTAEGCETSGAY